MRRGRRAEAAQAAMPPPSVLAQPNSSGSASMTAPATAWPDPLQRHRNVALMGEAELREYALQVGVTKRDAQELAPERLRVNILHVLHARIEELTS